MLIVIGFLVLFGLSMPSGDFLGGDGTELAPDISLMVFEAELGADLPTGVSILNFYKGGFQDEFVQIKLTATEPGLQALLGILDIGQPEPHMPTNFQMTALPWWDANTHMVGEQSTGRFGHYPYARLFVTSDPDALGDYLIYLMAFET